MGLKAVLDNLDSLDESLHQYYKQNSNGKYELQVAIEGVAGVKTFTDFNNLNEALRKERNDHRILKDSVASLGKPVEDVLKDLDRIPELEAARGQVDEEKLQQLVDAKAKSVSAPLEREIAKLKENETRLTSEVEQHVSRDRSRKVNDSLREACVELKVLPGAMEDVSMYAERVFEIDANGSIVVKDGVGATPGLSAKDWLTDMQSKRAHWWGETSNGGARGGKGGAGTSNPWGKDSWNMTEQGKLYSTDRTKAEQLAKAAGTTIGGPKPV